MIFELGDIQRFVIGGVHIVHTSGEARLHDVEVLVRECEVDDQSGLDLVQQRGGRCHIVCV